MHGLRHALALSGAMLLASAPAEAQLRRTSSIPSNDVPAGLCRIWIDGVPASRQPAPTDCTTARANAPANSHVIYGARSQGTVYGNTDPRNDPRLDPRDPRYDPRLDPRDPRYNPDYARSVLNDGRYGTRDNNGRYGDRDNNGRYGTRDRDKWTAKERERYERERAKAERRRAKEWKKDRKHEDDDDDDRGHRRDHHGH